MNPDTAQILKMLPSYPVKVESGVMATTYFTKQFPGTWTPQEYQEQTRQLVDAGCWGHDLMAWLVHAVQWPVVNNSSLQTWVSFWQTTGPYLRAWTQGSRGRIPEESMEVYATQLEWHPLWRAVAMNKVLDDFEFARDLRERPSLTKASRKALSSLGALELAASSADLDFRYACAVRLEKNGLGNGFSVDTSKVPHFLETPAFLALDTTFQRQLLMASLCSGRTELLAAECRDAVHTVWNNDLGKDEQLWWKTKVQSMHWTEEASRHLVQLRLHPLQFIHQEHEEDLDVLWSLNPKAFQSGYSVGHFLLNACSPSETISDLNTDIFSP